MTAGAPRSDDVDLSGGAAVAGGPNEAHANETEAEFNERIAAEREVERAEDEALAAAAEEARADEAAAAAGEEPTWAGSDDDPEASGESPSSNGQAGAPTPQTQTAPPSSDGSPPASAAPTAEAGGEGEPEPEPEPEPGDQGAESSRSGAASRPYTVLEEQEVVPYHLLTDAQKKTLAKHKAVGYVERGSPVVARNTEAALNAVYDEDGQPEHVSRVLPLSARSYQPVTLDLEPVQRSRLRIRR